MRIKFHDLTFEELLIKLEEVKKEYFKMRCNRVLSHVESTLQIRNLRRQIAQLNTLIYNHSDLTEASNSEEERNHATNP